jgi:quercetin dioxygenase-like cupin family protein
VRPGEAHRRGYWFLDNLVVVLVSGDETGGRFSLLEFLTPPGDMTPLHVHVRESQTEYVLEGELTVYLPDGERVLRAGDWLHMPAGVPQTERVTSPGPARVLDIGSPAGFERFVAQAGRPAEALTLPPPATEEPDLEALVALAADHGVEILGPPGMLPG